MSLSDKELRQRIGYGIARAENLIEEGEATRAHLQLVHDELSARIATAPTPTPLPSGVWTSPAELAALPTAGSAWDRVQKDAARSPGTANISDMHSSEDQYTLAAALVAARTGAGPDIGRALARIEAAVDTERDDRWISLSRNLAAYVIACDLLRPHLSSRVTDWLERLRTLRIEHNLPPHALRSWEPWHSGSNAAAQEGFACVALAAYHRDRVMLEMAWERFCVFVGERPGPIDVKGGVSGDWAHDADAPQAIVPAGETRGGRRLDGAIINDMRRGADYRWPPAWTQYPWVNLEGTVPAAYVLHRHGYPAFEVGDRAVLRTVEYLWYLRQETGDVRWFDGDRAAECVQLVNHAYGTSYPVDSPVGAGRTVGYTDWTHG